MSNYSLVDNNQPWLKCIRIHLSHYQKHVEYETDQASKLATPTHPK